MLGVHLLPDILQATHTNYHAIFSHIFTIRGSRIPNFGSQTSKLESRMSDSESRISNRTSNLGPRISDHTYSQNHTDLKSGMSEFESWLSKLGSRSSDLESRVSNLSVVKCSLIYL